MSERMRITYVRSAIGRHYKQKRTIAALGFTKLHQSRVVDWNESLKGMTQKVIHLLMIEPVEESSTTSEGTENNE
jgi:large subunit ribosomal protein L30